MHKDDRELFKDLITFVSRKTNVREDIVEKDYYVTLILQELSKADYPIVFKGGTSLSKAYCVIDRFSEDVDIGLSADIVARYKYVDNGKSVNGYYSGNTFANQLGITTQVPRIIEIVSNNASA